MAYKYYDKEKAKELFIQGYNLSEISILLKINRGTLNSWKNENNWKTLKELHNLDLKKNLPISKKAKHKEVLRNIINQLEYLSKELL